MRDPDLPEVLKAIDMGIRNAQNDYKKSYQSDVCSSFAPEYLMTVYIFQSILELKERCGCTYGLSLEESVYKMRKTLAINGRPSKQTPPCGKCDLSLIDLTEQPLVVIEVKKNPYDYEKDIKRLSYLVNNNLKYGVFASLLFEPVNINPNELADRLESETENLRKKIENYVRALGYDLNVAKNLGLIEDFKLANDPEEYKWCPVCFVIRK